LPMGMKDILLTPVKIKCRRDCPDRSQDCHGKCEIYAQYRVECDKLIHQRELNRDVTEAVGMAIKRKGHQTKGGIFNV